MPGISPRTLYPFSLLDLTRAPWGEFHKYRISILYGGKLRLEEVYNHTKTQLVNGVFGVTNTKSWLFGSLANPWWICIEYLKWCFVHLMGHDKPPQNSVIESNHLLSAST